MHSASRVIQVILLLVAVLGVSRAAIAAPVFWFGVVDPVVRADRHIPGSDDFMDMFRTGAPWAQGASRLSVYKFSTQFLLRSPDDAALQEVLLNLDRRHIAVAVELGLMLDSDRCGKGTEGYIDMRRVRAVINRLKRVGGRLDYIAMDEPLWYGHGQGRRNDTSCHDPIGAVVANIAATMRYFQQAFPGIRVGDIDPVVGRIDGYAYARDFASFADDFKAATGQNLAFFHADIAWREDWHQPLALIRDVCRKRGIPFGVIFGGEGGAPSDAAWVEQGLDHMREVLGDPRVAPLDQIVIQSWQTQPLEALPETQPGTMTYFLRAAENLAR